MGKIVVTEFVSLDGVMEDPGGSEDFKYGGWSFEYSRGGGLPPEGYEAAKSGWGGFFDRMAQRLGDGAG